MSWKLFARDLHDGRIEQTCILSDVERMKWEAEQLKQLVTEGTNALSAKSKKNASTSKAVTHSSRAPSTRSCAKTGSIRSRCVRATYLSRPSGMLWEWLVMPQGLKNAPATFNKCVTHLLRSVRDFAPSYFDDVFIHSGAVNGKSDVEMHKEHLRKLFALMRKHKLYANLKKCIFEASEIPVLAYAQRARYLVSNIVTNPIDEATKVVTFMKGHSDGPVKTNLFREYPSVGPPAGDAVERVDTGHAVSKTAAPSESHSHCKKQDVKLNFVILKVNSKREKEVGVDTVLSSIGLRAARARVDTADMLLISACSFGLDGTGYPSPLKEGATAPSTLGTRGCLMAFT
ncbi:unnamed protein product [Phytophthora fragariaefolia]|uniref:Unnamed protein product n=1 Tax=Phytophthora fragariaefolia TaxID=1490495 RepID=A0A9W6TP76_9STRA|nr:unnamed protein product [Phytophthora fragariaefolia]